MSVDALLSRLENVKRTRAVGRSRLRSSIIHARILAEAAARETHFGPCWETRFPALAELVWSALADAQSRRDRRRPMVHFFKGQKYRMEAGALDCLVVSDYHTGQKLASSGAFAL